MTDLSMQELIDFELPEGKDLECYRACAKGDCEKVEKLLAQGVDLEFTLFGWTPLMVICSKGHMWRRSGNDLVKLLLAAGSNIEAVDNGEKGFKRALHLACVYGGPDPLYQDNAGADIVRTLLDAGADIEAESDEKWKPLHYAVFFGRELIVKLLLERGADTTACTLLGRSPYIIAKEKRMKCELYEEKQTKIFERDAILAMLKDTPQPDDPTELFRLPYYFPED